MQNHVSELDLGSFDSDKERQAVIDFVEQTVSQQEKKRFSNRDCLHDSQNIRGYNHDQKFVLEDFISSLKITGFQASCLGQSISILREIRDQRIPLYLAFTSNIGTCGLRETITYLTKHNHVRSLATTAGAIEEDVMKTLGDFKLGDYRADDVDLFHRSIHRTGNIFIPTARYIQLHLFAYLLNKRLWRSHWREDRYVGVAEYVYELGRQMELKSIPRREESFVYWAYKNNIRIHCPALLDGALGDALYNYQSSIKERHNSDKRIVIDVMSSFQDLTEDMMVNKKHHGDIGIWAIGGSVPKHMLCNSAIYAGGSKHVVYVNTATEAEGSNAGAPISEAITWGKVHAEANAVKVEAEATLVVPLMVAAAYQTYTPSASQCELEMNEALIAEAQATVRPELIPT